MRAVQRLRERRVGPRVELRAREHLVIAAERHHVAPQVEPLGVDPHRPREPAGGNASRMRKRGAPPSRDATCAITRASVIGGRPGPGRKRPFHATCM